jgi:hypothetical protein
MTPGRWTAMALFLLFCGWLYNWKSGGAMSDLWYRNHWFPTNLPELLRAAGGGIAVAAADPKALLGTLAIGASGPAFWYTLAYSAVVVIFGLRRIRRRKTPYVSAQTLSLMAVQVLPLFLIPEIILPLLNYHGWLPRGLADALFPVVDYGHGREFWPGRSTSTTSSPTSRCGRGSRSASCRPACSSRWASTSSARASIAAGSARAGRWPRPWGTRIGTRCRTAPSGTDSTCWGR